MYLLRFILIALAVWLAVQLVRRLLRKPGKPARTTKAVTHRMVRCERCGLHVPEREAVREGERFFCSVEHRLEDKKPQ